MSKVLVVAVHPDDETLGCGGTLFKHKKNGDSIYWLIISSMNKDLGFSIKRIKERDLEIKKVAEIYNFSEVISLGYSTTQLDLIPKSTFIQELASVINRIKPEIMYVPYLYDAHSDHKVTYEVLSTFFKGFRYPYIKKILMMETPSETEFAYPVEKRFFSPNYFVDISDFIEDKISTMEIYNSEMSVAPFPRSPEIIKSLAAVRGSYVACYYAEAFVLIKEVIQ